MCVPRLVCQLLTVCAIVTAVDRSNFKTCEQSAFCKRHRRVEPGSSKYTVIGDSVVVKDELLEAVLVHENGKDKLKLCLTGLTDSKLRLIVDEVDPIRHRFKADDALRGPPIIAKYKSVTPGSGSTMLITLDGHKIVLQYKPFRLDVYSGTKELVLSLNSQGLFKYEKFRNKPEKKDEPTAEGENTDGETLDVDPPIQTDSEPTAEDEEGFWEETFKSHHDSKPFGSSSIGLDISFIGFQHVFGLPEHADAFALRTTTHTDPYRLYNLDVFEYETNNPMALYGHIPYIIGHSPTKTVGVFWLNAAEAWVDIKSSTADKGVLRSLVDRFSSSSDTPQVDTHWMFESGLVDIFIMLGPRPNDVFRQYADLTGVSELPPLFGIAYHQCRWNYNDMEDVKHVDAGFDAHDIPYDMLWLDIEHTDGKKYFTWDPIKFSDPKKMIDGIAAKGRRMVTIIDPHIKKDDGYKVYKEAKDNGYFIKNKDGQDYDGWCWPGASMYLDFMNPVVREYWAKHFRYDEYLGSTPDLFVWNDMNEPSVFNGPEVTMHKDAKHFGDLEHRDIHNMYGFYHHASTHKGLLERDGGKKRPFVLTRAFFAGSQRYSAVWTGDNAAEWSQLQISLPMMLTLSVTGIPFVGADVGGFFKNPDEELLVRWYQTGAFSPFFRAHAHLDTKRREPWLFSDETKKNIRAAIITRYQLLPYWYTLFREHSLTGMPVMRPMWLEFPEDSHVVDEDRQFMVGASLLVRPVTDTGLKHVSIYLPTEEIWYDYDTMIGRPGPGAVYVDTPIDKIPVMIRGGTIFVMRQRHRRASMLMLHDPLTIVVALNREMNCANGSLYLDDGQSYDYQTGKFIDRVLTFRREDASKASITSMNGDATSDYETDVWVEKIKVMGLRLYVNKVHLFVDDYHPTEVDYSHDPQTGILIIRKPAMNIGKDWRIDIHS